MKFCNTLRRFFFFMLCQLFLSFLPTSCVTCFVCLSLLGSVHTCNVTAYRNTVSWHCERDSWPRNVSKVGYAVTLRVCSVCCRYLTVASKAWYGYGWSRCGRATIRGKVTSVYPPWDPTPRCLHYSKSEQQSIFQTLTYSLLWTFMPEMRRVFLCNFYIAIISVLLCST